MAYQAIVHTVVDSIPVPLIVSEESKESYFPAWAENSLHSRDCLDMVLPLDEAILEAMCRRDKICEDLRRSYLICTSLPEWLHSKAKPFLSNL